MSSFVAEFADIQQMSNKLLCMIVTRLFIYRGCSSHYHGTLSSCDEFNKLRTPLSPETAFGIQ